VNTALGLGVGFDREQGIRIAGGFLVQVCIASSKSWFFGLSLNVVDWAWGMEFADHLVW